MVDFSKLLSPESNRRFAYFEKRCAEAKAMGEPEFVGYVVHHYHNMERCRFLPGEPVYDGSMHHTLVPEMLRRLGGGSLPDKCPVCDVVLDWWNCQK